MMEVEMDLHLVYEKSECTDSTDKVRDYRNGHKTKQVHSSFGSMDIEVPQDRLSEFEPHEYSGRFYTACPVMETVDSGMMETAIPEMQNQ